MIMQIKRARKYFMESEAGVNYLDANARYPVWCAPLPLPGWPLSCVAVFPRDRPNPDVNELAYLLH